MCPELRVHVFLFFFPLSKVICFRDFSFFVIFPIYCKRVFAKLSIPTKAKHGSSDLKAATSCSYTLRIFAVAAY